MGACLGIIVEPLLSFAAGMATYATMAVETVGEVFTWANMAVYWEDTKISVAIVLIRLWEVTHAPWMPPPPLMPRDDVDLYRNGTNLGDARLKIFFENRDKDYP